MQIVWSVVLGSLSFVLGQIFQQYILTPIQEFGRQRADAIYFAVRFMDLTNSTLSWSAEDKATIKDMKAVLYCSLEMIPNYAVWQLLFRLPNRTNIKKAADEIAELAIIVNNKSGAVLASDARKAEEVAMLLGAKISKH